MEDLCERCGCCSLEHKECEYCSDGFSGHDCGEDTCCCLYPEDNIICDVCDGEGYWFRCFGGCDKNGLHKKEMI